MYWQLCARLIYIDIACQPSAARVSNTQSACGLRYSPPSPTRCLSFQKTRKLHAGGKKKRAPKPNFRFRISGFSRRKYCVSSALRVFASGPRADPRFCPASRVETPRREHFLPGRTLLPSFLEFPFANFVFIAAIVCLALRPSRSPYSVGFTYLHVPGPLSAVRRSEGAGERAPALPSLGL